MEADGMAADGMEADGMALYHAAASGNLKEVDRLTKGGVDSNVRNAEDDSTPLHVASSRGHLDVGPLPGRGCGGRQGPPRCR